MGGRFVQVKLRDVYTSRYYKHGTSFGIIIPPDIRQAMQLRPGDVVMMNFSFGVMWCVRASADVIINREKVSQVFEQLFAKEAKRNEQHEQGI